MIEPYFDNGKIRLYLGDCREVLPQLPQSAIDLCVTDPAYKVTSGGNNDQRGMGGIFAYGTYDNSGDLFPTVDFAEWVSLVYSALKTDADCYIMTNDKNIYAAQDAAFKAGFQLHNVLVWNKRIKTPNRWYMKSCEFINYFWKGHARILNDCGAGQYDEMLPPKDRTINPTAKPEMLMRKYIANSSNPGDTVLEPFAGSGTTLYAAHALGRCAIGIELEERQCDAIARTLSSTQIEYSDIRQQMAMV